MRKLANVQHGSLALQIHEAEHCLMNDYEILVQGVEFRDRRSSLRFMVVVESWMKSCGSSGEQRA